MSEELSNQIRELQTAVEQAARRRQRAEVERDAAEQALSKVESRLAEFGVSTAEEAKELLSSMENSLQLAVSEVRSALEGVGGM